MYVQTMFHFSYVVWRVSRIFQFSEACQASGNATWMTNTDYSVRAFIHLQIYGIFYKWRDFHRKNLHFSFFKMIRKAFSRFEKREAGSKEREHWGITARRRRKHDCWAKESNIADEEESKAAHVASLTAADDAETIRQKENPHAKRHGGSKNISQNENLS